MEINIRDHDKIVEIWLTNAEKRAAGLKESLKPIYALYKGNKYTIAVFESGDGDMFEATRDLLLHNRMLLGKE